VNVVPRLWPGETIVCLATGPSLTSADVDYCRGRARVIAVKNASDLAQWADAVYSADSDTTLWWKRNGDRLHAYSGLRYTLDPAAAKWATVLRNTGFTGLELDPSGLRTGKNSGYQAINLAVHLGAKRIILLGYDMQTGPKGEDHFFGAHPFNARPPLAMFVPFFDTLVEPLRAAGVEILNASRVSALTCFPKVALVESLEAVAA